MLTTVYLLFIALLPRLNEKREHSNGGEFPLHPALSFNICSHEMSSHLCWKWDFSPISCNLFLFSKKLFHHFLSFHATSTSASSYAFSYSLSSSLFPTNIPNFIVLVSLTLQPTGMAFSGRASDLVSLSVARFCKHRVSDLHARMCFVECLMTLLGWKGVSMFTLSPTVPKTEGAIFCRQ